MECPFELPVSKSQMPKNTKGIKLYRIDKVYFPYTEEEAAYIVQAINSHEKLVETLRKLVNDHPAGLHIPIEPASLVQARQVLEAEK